jgi:aspartate racemase
MGPEATILLMQKVLDAVPGRHDSDYVPLLVDQNPQVPSRIDHLILGTGDSPAPVLAGMAARLEAAGAAALAMPCNTAHHYADAIRGAVDIPFLDMVALSADHAAGLVGPGGRVGVLGSPALRRVGLLDAPLAARGLVATYPDDEVATLESIREIKAHGPTQAACDRLRAAVRRLQDRGAEAIMVACTEFSLVADRLDGTARLFDSLDILVTRIVRTARAPVPGGEIA